MGRVLACVCLAWGSLLPSLLRAQSPDAVVVPPRLIHQVPVHVRADAAPLTQDVTVVLRLTVDEAGEVTRVEVVQGAGDDLDDAALGAACGFEFEPAEVDGTLTAVQVDFRYTFTAQKAPPSEPLAAEDVPGPAVHPDPGGPVAAEPGALEAAAGASMFSGVVLDDATQQPLPDVEVYLRLDDGEAMVANTSTRGRFELVGIPPGRHLVAMTATGFEQFSVLEDFHAGEHLTAEYTLRRVAANAFETVVRDRVRRAGRVSMVVGSATSVSEEALEQMAPTSANEVLRRVPGVNVVDEEGMGLRPNIGIRGTDPIRSRKILVLEDGAPIALQPYGAPDTYYSPPIERMRQVDVSKGSDSILQGPQTIGGVVNYLTVEPPRKLTVVTEARAGSAGYWLGHLAVGDTVGPVGYRVDFLHRSFDGPRHLQLQLLDVTGKVRVQFSPRHSVSLKLSLYDEFSNATYKGLTTEQYDFNSNDNFAIHDRFWIRRAATGVNHEFIVAPWLRLQTIAYGNVIQRNWQRQEYDREDQGAAYERVVPGRPGEDPHPGTSIFFRNSNVHRNRRYTVAGIEPRVILAFPVGVTHHQLIAGARLHGERAEEQRLDGETAVDASGALTEDEIRTGVALASYAQYRLTLFDRLRITPGIRVEAFWAERHTLRTRVVTPTGVVAVPADTLARAPTYALIPGLGISYLVSDGLMFYAGIHRGFAPPRTADNITPGGDNLNLAGEYSWNMEAGSRLSLGDFLQAEGAVFYLDFENQVISPSDAGGATSARAGQRLINGGRSRHVGAETSVTLDVARLAGWNFRVPYTLSYTFVDTRWVGGAWDGNLLPYAPQHVAAAQLQFIHPNGFSAQLGGTFVSPQFTDNNDSKLPGADGTTGVIGRRFLVDGRVAYTVAPLGLTFSLMGKNLTDYRYISSRAPEGIQPGLPRQFMVGVRGEI